ncbi:GATA transcription factor 18 [Morella rubra]|uniref:GATA transcription factor 18 n=1 Tax=Morella rubra TaxID=262757 RepID=A0A6A1UFU4_9ROSI|nr:GATA transcription factor 18 [Morella rubra]
MARAESEQQCEVYGKGTYERRCTGRNGGDLKRGFWLGEIQSQYAILYAQPRPYEESEMYSFTSSSTSVDCTISLGTPSTHLMEDDEKRRRSASSVSNFCWDLLQTKIFHKGSAASVLHGMA